ncbi:CD209 antigen-like protein C [Misgurnus anguillicaudatus]|uniref:CD209 antigen-like protein C n=1 Tax=Misgurnus anguillicaudatus TaxID=75329 RepID=UPI003CCFD444
MQVIDKEDGKEEMNVYEKLKMEELNTYDVCMMSGIENSDTKRKQTSQHTGSECVKMRRYRSDTVCLVLLCVLLLTAVIVLCVLIKNLTKERDQQRNQLTQYINVLMKILKADGWMEYQSSLYFISSEQKSWSESRSYCRDRGADLIIINNKEEQDFIEKISGTTRFWIGLSDVDEERRWKWVDNSTLNTSFWASKEPNGDRGENCAESASSEWNDQSCNSNRNWICERKQ